MESDHYQLPRIYQALYIIHDDVYIETGKYMFYCCSWTPEISQDLLNRGSRRQLTVHKQGMVKTGSIITWTVQ